MDAIRIISPQNDGYHYFFGYYDLQPYSGDMSRHLAHRVKFMDRLPLAEDVCDVGYIDLMSGEFVKIGETTAWNFQQGAMLQWFDENSVIYNIRHGNEYRSVIKSTADGKERLLCRPVACLSNDRKYALGVNFSRIYDFRPGYGYAGISDSYANECAPKDDGIYLVDLTNDTHKLIVSYNDIKTRFYQKPYSDQKLLVNHITFNPSGSRFLFLLRNFPEKGSNWGTQLITSDLCGEMRLLTGFEVNSHYHWRDDENIMIFAAHNGEYGIYFINDLTKARSKLNEKMFSGDIHCLYSPDRTLFCGDGYPDNDEMRTVYLYNFKKRAASRLLKVKSVKPDQVDIRCDLHARWCPDGSALSFDTTHNGKREIAVFNLL